MDSIQSKISERYESRLCQLDAEEDGFLIFAPNALVPLRIAVSNMTLRAKVKAAGGNLMPEEQL